MHGCPLLKAFKNGGANTAERLFYTWEGNLYCEVTASPVTTNSGKIIAGIEIAKDITARKSAEEKLKMGLEENILSNIKHLIGPYIKKLRKSRATSKEVSYLDIIESNLNEITSSFSSRLLSKHRNLTKSPA